METNQSAVPKPAMTQESVVAPNFAKAASGEEAMTDKQMLQEIYENTRKTKNYMKWQLYITLILVVLPLLAAIFIVPFAMNSLSNAYLAPLQGLQ